MFTILSIPCGAPAEESKLEQGVRLEIRTAEGEFDVRYSRLVALFVPEGDPATPFVSSGPFSATWTGNIEVDLRDRFRFGFEGNGTFQFYIDGRVRLDADSADPESLVGRRARLGKGSNPFIATYQSPATGEAECRLMWESTEFPMETVPATVLTHSTTDEGFLKSMTLRKGRELVGEYRCLNCHAPKESTLDRSEAMLELFEDAPSMETIATRTRPEWIPLWLENPQRFHPDSTMPRMLPGPYARQDAMDIAAYFESMDIESEPDIKGNSEEGRELFNQLGCIACHVLSEAETESDPYDRTPLGHIPAKWKSSGELSEFLQNPQSHFKSIRMPHFKLTKEEADNLASLLMDREVEPVDSVTGDAERGGELVATLGCLSCHGPSNEAEASTPSFEEVRVKESAGCLSLEATGERKAPLFPLSPKEIGAIQVFLKSGPIDSLNRSDPAETAERYTEKLRCNACHERDGEFDVWTLLNPPREDLEEFEEDLGDAEIDQSRPSLTFIGEKLRPDWLKKRLLGEVGEDIRPWLDSRMPCFPFHAEVLAEGLAQSHGFSPKADPIPEPDAELAELGERLVSQKEGFACTTCHPIGDYEAQAVYESMGTNLMVAAERLRPGYALHWMFNPLRVNPKTKMPRYTSEHGNTPLVTLLDGEGVRQFEAIWHYLLRGREIEAPEVDLK